MPTLVEHDTDGSYVTDLTASRLTVWHITDGHRELVLSIDLEETSCLSTASS